LTVSPLEDTAMRVTRVQFTVRRLMAAVLLAGGLNWFTSRVWNREYTETCFLWCWPATRATYTRTYGDWFLEQLGLKGPHRMNWTPIPEPPPPFWLQNLPPPFESMNLQFEDLIGDPPSLGSAELLHKP
jgi:hypothetical protein